MSPNTSIAADLAFAAWFTSPDSACSPLVRVVGSARFALFGILIRSSLPDMKHCFVDKRFSRYDLDQKGGAPRVSNELRSD